MNLDMDWVMLKERTYSAPQDAPSKAKQEDILSSVDLSFLDNNDGPNGWLDNLCVEREKRGLTHGSCPHEAGTQLPLWIVARVTASVTRDKSQCDACWETAARCIYPRLNSNH